MTDSVHQGGAGACFFSVFLPSIEGQGVFWASLSGQNEGTKSHPARANQRSAMENSTMNQRHLFRRLLEALHAAALDDALWPAASRLIDEACGATGSSVVVGEGDGDDARVCFAAFYRRGKRRRDLERDYYDNYFHQDERVPRLLRLREGKLVRVANLYSATELKTSATWNEALPRSGTQNGLIARLAGLHGLRVTWIIANPVTGNWDTGRIRMIRRLLPHVRNFVNVRQAMADAGALGSALFNLPGNSRLGVIHVGRNGRIALANDRAQDLLREASGLRQQDGFLRAWLPGDDARLGRLVASALPTIGERAVGGSMQVRHPAAAPVLTLHVHPLGSRQTDFGVAHAGALVLIESPDISLCLDAGLVASVLGLSPSESRVALWLAEGKTVPQIASLTGRRESSIRTHLKRIHHKLGVSRRAELVRLVLSVPGGTALRDRL